MIAEHDEAP